MLGGFLIYTGISHLTINRIEFLAQVPTWLPLDADLVVVLSGIAEIALGAALILLRRYRALVGWLTAAFFVIIFPGNIAQYTNGIDAFGLNSDTARFVRLLFQPLLVVWAIWCTGAWQAWRNRRQPPSDPAGTHQRLASISPARFSPARGPTPHPRAARPTPPHRAAPSGAAAPRRGPAARPARPPAPASGRAARTSPLRPLA